MIQVGTENIISTLKAGCKRLKKYGLDRNECQSNLLLKLTV